VFLSFFWVVPRRGIRAGLRAAGQPFFYVSMNKLYLLSLVILLYLSGCAAVPAGMSDGPSISTENQWGIEIFYLYPHFSLDTMLCMIYMLTMMMMGTESTTNKPDRAKEEGK